MQRQVGIRPRQVAVTMMVKMAALACAKMRPVGCRVRCVVITHGRLWSWSARVVSWAIMIALHALLQAIDFRARTRKGPALKPW
jgi:asparagine N-glycosylation enzyme membrane subunit Stt3